MTLWRLPAEDPNDDPTVIRTSAELDLPTLDLEMVDGDGFMSPARARRLAMLLNAAADYAESCVIVNELDVEGAAS